MRPRSRLLCKRRVQLPTIREGSEEMVRDMNQTNSLLSAAHSPALSSEDYLLSICHLAHPTFPARELSLHAVDARRLDALHQRLRLPRLGCDVTATFDLLRGEREDGAIEPVVHGCHGVADPLEYLYGHHGSSFQLGNGRRRSAESRAQRGRGEAGDGQPRSRAYSVPHAWAPVHQRQHQQRKSSCPDLAGASSSGISTENDGAPWLHAGEERVSEKCIMGDRQVVKQSMISQWISDCRSAWREARVRACMLPAIAEI